MRGRPRKSATQANGEETVANEAEEDSRDGENQNPEAEGCIAGVVGESQRPKLAEGFYEIDEIRRKRVRKGQTQYLIKWRGWPENANTWEPFENLDSCRDIIEAFEESNQSKSLRGRKRKSGGSIVHPKKKQAIPMLEDVDKDEPLPEKAGSTDPEKVDPVEIPVDNGRESELKQQIDNIVNDSNENSGNISVLLPENKPSEEEDTLENGYSNFEAVVQTGRYVGARKRKAGSVRRFIQDFPSDKLEGTTQNVTAKNANDEREGDECVGGELSHVNDKMEGSISTPYITKILKPIGYSVSVTNDAHDALVTFMALRSDGKEVPVDNKFLKANYPQLLIGFYEQHLRYNSM